MMWDRLSRAVLAAVGDDGTGRIWARLTQDGQRVLRFAYLEARELGHPGIADEHLLLGILRHDASRAADLLEAEGLDLAGARAGLLRVGPTLQAAPSGADALRAFGVDVEHVRTRLEAEFGAEALRAAERRVRRRPRWRGGRGSVRPLCVHLLAKRALEIAARAAAREEATGIGPDHLLHGVLQDALDPLGTQLSRRGRRQLARYGFVPGRPNPVRLQLEAHGIELPRLAAQLRS